MLQFDEKAAGSLARVARTLLSAPALRCECCRHADRSVRATLTSRLRNPRRL